MMNEENYWDHNMEVDAVEGPENCVRGCEVLQALKIRKL